MTIQQKSSRALHISLWIAQILLAATFAWAGCVKLFQTVEQVASMWPWAAEVPVTFLKFTGIVDLLGALGLILPSLLRIRPNLTPITAICIIVQMICASIFHIVRGEGSSIGANIVFAIFATFIAWGRFRNAKRSI